jgi:hypothetical protein
VYMNYTAKFNLGLGQVKTQLKSYAWFNLSCSKVFMWSGPPGGQIAPGPEVLGAPENFLLGSSLFCVLNISAQRKYLTAALHVIERHETIEIWTQPPVQIHHFRIRRRNCQQQ